MTRAVSGAVNALPCPYPSRLQAILRLRLHRCRRPNPNPDPNPDPNPNRLSDASTSIGVVDFASQATVISQLSTDATAVEQAIDASNDPRGYTHISEGLKVGI